MSEGDHSEGEATTDRDSGYGSMWESEDEVAATGSANHAQQRSDASNASEASNHAQQGSDEDEDSKPLVQCYTMNGDRIGDSFTIDRDATVGNLIQKLKKHAQWNVSDKWFHDKKFIIGEVPISFEDPYMRFTQTTQVQNVFRELAGKEIPCTIVMSVDPNSHSQPDTDPWNFLLHPG